MKAKTFENLLRKIVREEIDYSLRREIKSLKEDLRDEFKPTIVEHTENLVEVPNTSTNTLTEKNSLREKIMGNKPIKQRPKQQFSKNNTLNDLLNETAQGDTNTESAMAPVNLSEPFASGAPMPTDTTGMPAELSGIIPFLDAQAPNSGSDVANYGERSNNSYILNEPECVEVKKFVLQHVKEFAENTLLYDYNTWEISQSWVSRKQPGQHHTMHTHPNSLISGVFYW